MGSESIAHEAKGQMGYSLRSHEPFSKIQPVGQKYLEKTTLASKTHFSHHCLVFKAGPFFLLVGYNI